jgi:nucleotide-binding universal stress UspA family protein
MKAEDATSVERTPSQRPIVVGVDWSESSIEALREGARFAELLGTPLRAVTAWRFPPFEAMPSQWDPEEDAQVIARESANAVWGTNWPSWFEIATRRGPAALALIEESDSAQMLFVGSRGHGGFAGLLLGSVSSQCAEHAKCPVLVLHDAQRRE